MRRKQSDHIKGRIYFGLRGAQTLSTSTCVYISIEQSRLSYQNGYLAPLNMLMIESFNMQFF